MAKFRQYHIVVISALFFCFLFCPLLPRSASAALGKGSEAPDFSLTDLKGRTVTLSEFKGKIVVVTFWATYCHGCKAEIPYLNRYFDTYGNKEAVLLSITLDKVANERIQECVDRFGVRYPVLRADRDVVRDYRIRAIPITFLINREGKVERIYIGPEATALLGRHTEELLSPK